MDDDDDLVWGSRWLRIRWTDILAFGIGLDPHNLIIGLYLGPVGIYLGDDEN